MKIRRTLFMLFVMVCLACSSDDAEVTDVQYSGTVIGFDGCNSENGLYYKIQLDDGSELDFIRTNTLPDSLSEKGTRILFDIREIEDSHQFCQQHIAPPYHFYEVYNIALKE